MAYELEVVSNLTDDGAPTSIMNATEFSTGDLAASPQIREIANRLSRWVDNARSASGRTSMLDRGMFIPPENPYDEMRAARNAVRHDSVVAGIADLTEAIAFDHVKWESPDPDEADVFNQLAGDQNLDAVVRAMWREEYTYNQFVCAGLWGWREYTVRGKTSNGNQRKKKKRIYAPLQLRLLDPMKTVPVGVGPLGGERLAWQSTVGEIGYYQSVYSGDTIDPLMLAFFDGTYIPGVDESAQLSAIKVDPTRLLAMNQDLVWRHTTTKPDYERFPDVSMKAIFGLLDLKRQLMSSDRAVLIGSANYILLIKKGDKDRPAQPEEISHLRENYNFIAKMPVIISDDRLNIEIIAPKTDFVLQNDKYDVLDHRILQRLLGTMSISGRGQRNETQETISYVVARNMENRRHMLKRMLELRIAKAVVQHPRNAGMFTYEPNLVYTPRGLALAMQPAYIQGLQALRTQRDISRETILEYFGLDQETEAMRLTIEEEHFDDIFKTEVPYTGQGPAPVAEAPAAPKKATTTKDGPNKKGAASAPASGQPSTGKKKVGPNGTPEAPGVSGARGGRPVGGGKTKKSPAAIAKPRTSRGNPSTKASDDEGPSSE